MRHFPVTDDILQNIILSKRLPKDELDRLWDNLWGFFPATLFLITGLGPILAPRTTMTKASILIVLILGAVIFLYTVYAKLTERNLKFIETKLTKEDNELLIKNLSEKEGWARLTNLRYFHAFMISSVGLGHSGFKLTLVPTENGILVNFRNRGSGRGRMPYQLGLETFNQKKVEKKIKNYA